MQDQLARLDRARKQFIASASHELRTPIFSLGGFLELLADEDLDEETRRAFLDQMRGQVDAHAQARRPSCSTSRGWRPARSSCGPSRPTSASSRARSRPSSRPRPRSTTRTSSCDLPSASRSSSTATPSASRRCCGSCSTTPSSTRRRAPASSFRPARDERARRASRSPTTASASSARTCPHIFEPFFTSDDGRRAPASAWRSPASWPSACSGELTVRSVPGRDDVLAGAAGMRRALAGCSRGRGAARRLRRRRLGRGEDSGAGGPHRPGATTRVEVVERRGRAAAASTRSAIYKREAPGVVTVVSLFGSAGSTRSRRRRRRPGGVGSGFVLDGNGEIATNAHVVTTGEGDEHQARAREVYVEFADGNQVEAEDRRLRPQRRRRAAARSTRRASRCARCRSATAHDVAGRRAGRRRSARPFGEQQSLSVGVVSGVDRSIESLTDFQISGAIQTDAAINPGNSGRAAGRRARARDRRSTSRSSRTPAAARASGSRCRSTSSSARSTSCARTARPLRVPRRVSRSPLYPQLAEQLRPAGRARARGCRSCAGGPADKAGLRAGKEDALPGAGAFTRRRRRIIAKVDGRSRSADDDLVEADRQLSSRARPSRRGLSRRRAARPSTSRSASGQRRRTRRRSLPSG